MSDAVFGPPLNEYGIPVVLPQHVRNSMVPIPRPPSELQINEERAMWRRISRENALYEQGCPVAGHDPHEHDF